MSDELADQIISHGMHEMSAFQIAEPMQQIGHLQRYRGFPGSRFPGKAHVQSRPRRGEAEFLPDPVDQQQRSDLFDLLLHRQEADQFAVQASGQRRSPSSASSLAEPGRHVLRDPTSPR